MKASDQVLRTATASTQPLSTVVPVVRASSYDSPFADCLTRHVNEFAHGGMIPLCNSPTDPISYIVDGWGDHSTATATVTATVAAMTRTATHRTQQTTAYGRQH